MENLISSFVSILVDLGLPGIIIAASLYYIYYLVRKKDELQEARLAEYKILIETVEKNTSCMRDLRDVIRACKK